MHSKRDLVSEIDYSDSKSAIENLKLRNKPRVGSQAKSHLTNENLKQFDKESHKSLINKGGGASIYSDVRSTYSKYKTQMRQLSSCSQSHRNGKLIKEPLITIPEVDDNKFADCNKDKKFWHVCKNLLKQSEIDFHNQMVTSLSQKEADEQAELKHHQSLAQQPDDNIEDPEENDQNQAEEDVIPILCAKCVYNSYLKRMPVVQADPVKPQIKPLRKEQNDSKSSYNLKAEIQK